MFLWAKTVGVHSLLYFALPSAATPCTDSRQWFDTNKGRCRPCSPCGRDHVQLADCSTYEDTFCAPLAELTVSGGSMNNAAAVPSWHEREFAEDPFDRPESAGLNSLQQPGSADTPDMSAAAVAVTVLGIAFVVAVAAVVVSLLAKHGRCRRSQTTAKHDPRRLAGRARLFSRDRLDTTEYVHSLSRLDMRLAMDEILEKRKQAILDTQLPLWDSSNSYGDDVFIDVKDRTSLPDDADQQGRLLAQGHGK